MRRTLIILLIIVAYTGTAVGQEILGYSVHIDVSRVRLNQEVTIQISNLHETELNKFTYPFPVQIENIKTYDETGGLQSQVVIQGGKKYVTTELRDSINFGENATVLFDFEDPTSLTFFNGTYLLSTSFPLLANVRQFDLTLKLPQGTGLKDPAVDVVPAPSEITSDGRVVILKWIANNPSDFRIFVRFETIQPQMTSTTTTTTSTSTTTTILLEDESGGEFIKGFITGSSAFVFLIFVFLIVVRLKSRKRIDEKIDILKEDEQLILKMVALEDGIEQRQIQRNTDFSKTKVSKILAELEKRGAIRKETMGKKNKIYLTEKLKE
jgi:uncharacterized membrane protein